MFLAGDVGATKTQLAIYREGSDLRKPLLTTIVSSEAYPTLESLVQDFIGQANMAVQEAALGVPGPVVDGKAVITNLPWQVDAKELKRTLRLTNIHLCNDVEAIASSIPLLLPEDLRTIIKGQPEPHGTIAVIAPGTGLGEAFLTSDGDKYRQHPSEGGHVDFAPTTSQQIALLDFLRQRFHHVSYERLCSGQGLPNIFHFLRATNLYPEPPWLADRLTSTTDITATIVNAASSPSLKCELCTATVEMFVTILAAASGNLALAVLARGGVYLAGGMSPHLLPFLESPSFSSAFLDKGRLSHVLGGIPVYVIMNSRAPLIGAAAQLSTPHP